MQHDLNTLTEAFEYLDELRESGETNMWGAVPYIERDLGHDNKTSKSLQLKWMESFDGETSAYDRAKKFIPAETSR